MKRKYRVIEYDGTFKVQVLTEKKTGIWPFRKTKFEWLVADIEFGQAWVFTPFMPIFGIAQFKTLEEAKAKIRLWQTGEIVHEVE